MADGSVSNKFDVFAACGVVGDKPQMRLVTVTEEIAAALLALNTRNRPKRGHQIASLTADFVAGRYILLGDALMVSTDHKLTQGQHRLIAFLDACAIFKKRGVMNFTAQFWIFFNSSPDAMKVADQNVPRNTSDGLVVFGKAPEKGAKPYSAILRALYILDTDAVFTKFKLREAEIAEDAFSEDVKWAMLQSRAHDKMSAAPWLAALAYARPVFPAEVEKVVSALKDPNAPISGTLRLLRAKFDAGGVGHGHTVQRNEETYMFLNALHKVCAGGGDKAIQFKTTHNGGRIVQGYEFFRKAREKKGLPVLPRKMDPVMCQ